MNFKEGDTIRIKTMYGPYKIGFAYECIVDFETRYFLKTPQVLYNLRNRNVKNCRLLLIENKIGLKIYYEL